MPKPNVLQNDGRTGSSRSRFTTDPDPWARSGASHNSTPLIPVASPPPPPVFGVGLMDKKGNTLHLGAGALEKIRAKYASQLAKVRENREAEQMEKVEKEARLAVRSKL